MTAASANLPTVDQVARKARVSRALVSRFINQDPDLCITEDKRQRILRAAEKLGGLPVGRGTKRWQRRLTYRICMPINEQFAPIDTRQFASFGVTAQMTSFLLQTLRSMGYRLDLTFYNEADKAEDFRRLIEAPAVCDGVVLHGKAAGDAVAQLLLSRRFPHVSLDAADEARGLNTLLVSETQVLDEAMAHLRGAGHRLVAYMGPRSYHRYPLVIRAIAAGGCDPGEQRHCFLPDSRGDSRWSVDRGRTISAEYFGRWLDEGPSATALFCSSDHVMLGAIDAMRARGLKPGRDLSLIGYNNCEQREQPAADNPYLTTIDHPSERLGERCAALLMQQIQGQNNDPVHERIATRLILRETTGPCPAARRGSQG